MVVVVAPMAAAAVASVRDLLASRVCARHRRGLGTVYLYQKLPARAADVATSPPPPPVAPAANAILDATGSAQGAAAAVAAAPVAVAAS